MSIETVEAKSREDWERAVEQSPQATYFHQYDPLVALAEYFDAELHLLLSYVGQEPVCLFPVFEQSKGPLVLATSPPLSVEIHTGPALLNFDKLTQRKAEKRHQSVIDSVLAWIESEIDPDYHVLKLSDRYTDVRPFLRNDFDVKPSYTYILDLQPDIDEIQSGFSRSARNNVRTTDDDRYRIEVGGQEEIRSIISLVDERFDAIDEYYYLDSTLVCDLYRRSDGTTVRPYVCRVDGETVAGIIALEIGDTVYRWQSGTQRTTDLPATVLLDWRIIQDAKQRGYTRYDFVGAMLPELCKYKAKFGPEPRPVHIVRESSLTASLLERAYDRLPESARQLMGI